MKMKSLLCLIVLCFAITGSIQAKKKTKKKGKANFVLIEAYSQRIVPGMRRSVPPPPVTHFIIIWESKRYPVVFYWLKDTGQTYTCNIVKAHKITDKSSMMPEGKDYYTENITPGNIHVGDTLDITTLPLNKYAYSEDLLNVNTKNTLFFKTSDNKMGSVHIDTVFKKRDILMP